MRLRRSAPLIIIVVLICMPQLLQSQDPGRRYRINGPSSIPERQQVLNSGAELHAIGTNAIDIRANTQQINQIQQLGYSITPLDQSSLAVQVDPAYLRYTELISQVQQIAAAHPTIVSLFSIGNSYEGRILWAAKISDNVDQDENEPEALFVGRYHAREPLTSEMMLGILKLLTDTYDPQQPDTQITRLVNTRQIYLIFMLNPDGSEYDMQFGTYQYWRKNRQPDPGFESNVNGTDPNRNHGFRWGGIGSSSFPYDDVYHGPAPRSAPEIAAIEDFINSRVQQGTQRIRVAITFHTYGELVLWPFGSQSTAECGQPDPDMPSQDQQILQTMGTAMAQLINYIPQPACALYPTTGDFSDWAYGVHGIYAYTFEMHPCSNSGCPTYGFYPPGNVITTETKRVEPAVRYLLEYASCPVAAIDPATTTCRVAWHTSYLPWISQP